jgi:GT2 family glycosyltransferase
MSTRQFNEDGRKWYHLMEGAPSVAILILNWNKWNLTLECLESTLQNNYPNFRLVLIDNGSQDGSVDKILEYCQGRIAVDSPFFTFDPNNKPIEVRKVNVIDKNTSFEDRSSGSARVQGSKLILLALNENLGYAEGNNVGMRFILRDPETRYIVFMNNDVVVERDFLKHMVSILEASEDRVAIGSPKILYYDYHGSRQTINNAGSFIDTRYMEGYKRGMGEIDKGQYAMHDNLEWADGACFIMRADALRKTGSFDKEFFAYWEETDLGLRARKMGYRIIFIPESVVWHHESASIDSDQKSYLMTRNRFLLIKKNGSRNDVLRFIFIFFSVKIFLICADYIKRGQINCLRSVLRGSIAGLRISLKR